MPVKLRVGITGGIGSGKSEVSKVIERNGYTVINADDLAKKLMVKDKKVRGKIKGAFGEKAYKSDGSLNREYLAEKVFANEAQVKKINSIVHPAVFEETERLMEIELRKKDIVFSEAALIYEADMEEIFDYVILVTSEEQIRINRVMSSSGWSEAQIRDRMKNQLPEDKKKGRADFVIDNNGSLFDLQNKGAFFLRLLENIAGGKVIPKEG